LFLPSTFKRAAVSKIVLVQLLHYFENNTVSLTTRSDITHRSIWGTLSPHNTTEELTFPVFPEQQVPFLRFGINYKSQLLR
jgi:hypothetical protein